MEKSAGSTTPIVCDRSTATGTPATGIAEYQSLFTRALVGRERTADGIVFRFRADDGIEAWIRDLAAREKACCAFFAFTITQRHGQVWWETRVPDDEVAHAVLDEFYALPDTVGEGVETLEKRFTRRGLRMVKSPAETVGGDDGDGDDGGRAGRGRLTSESTRRSG